jgi:hypothetical protein
MNTKIFLFSLLLPNNPEVMIIQEVYLVITVSYFVPFHIKTEQSMKSLENTSESMLTIQVL